MSFLLHVDGPWGAGKSSLLHYLRDELEADSLVVDVNAWREQRAGPAWLGLLMALRRAAFHRYGWRLRARELLARTRAIGAGYLAVTAVAGTLTVGALWWAAAGEVTASGLGDAARSLAALVALATTAWAASTGLSRSLLPGSPRQAEQYVERHADPMQKVAEHFDEFLRLVRHPVVIMIDDLDRCTEGYVVEFLEAVQTLLREQPPGRRVRRRPALPAPYFVVAADGRWIRASYERQYAAFAEEVAYPGRPLGYLFLEKAFQLTTTLPAIDPHRRTAYLDHLLRVEASDTLRADADVVRRADDLLRGATTDADILDRITQAEQDPRTDPTLRFALLGQAVQQMARADVTGQLEHALRHYADLLDPNPRAMKRFLNAYGVERALRTIEGRHPRLDQLARWTVLQLRWPELAEVLRMDPDAAALVGRPVRGAIPDGVRPLFTDPEVTRVVTSADPRHGAPLDAEAIRACAGLPSTDEP